MNPNGDHSPYQYQPPTPHARRRPRRWPWIAGIIGAFALGGVVTATNPPTTQPAAANTVTVTAPAPPAPPAVTRTVTVTKTVRATVKVTVTPAPLAMVPGDGTYLVGPDMPPGVWRSAPTDSGNCYWARLSSTDTGDIIDNNNTTGPTVVTVRRSDAAFESAGCSEWRRVA